MEEFMVFTQAWQAGGSEGEIAAFGQILGTTINFVPGQD